MTHPDRTSARIEGDFVVFLIGMRINTLHRPDKWGPTIIAMARMLPELFRNPDLGLLGSRTRWAGRHIDLVQYWRSFDHLHRYARARDAEHLPAWAAYNRSVQGNDAVGVWHETYLIRAGEHESVYRSMPPYGLAEAAGRVEAVGELSSATGRLGRGAESVDAAILSRSDLTCPRDAGESSA